MKALTIRQPWAWAIAEGHKRIETRSRRTHFRGEIAIHAAKRWDWEVEPYVFAALIQLRIPPTTTDAGYKALSTMRQTAGHVVATAELVDCFEITGEEELSSTELELGDFTPGRFGWKLANVRPVSPTYAATGKLGFWEWEDPRAKCVECGVELGWDSDVNDGSVEVCEECFIR